MLGVSVATLRWWKHIGKGPKSIKLGPRIRYWRQDVLDWLEEQERLSELPALWTTQLNSQQ